MGSKGRMPPAHMRRPHPGPGLLHPDPFGPGMRSLPGEFPFDMLPPPEIMEQKLDAQEVEMQRLLTENKRIAATHLTLRQDLAAAQHELERMQSHMGALRGGTDQEVRVLLDKIASMEADLQASEPRKAELKQLHGEAQILFAAKQELYVKCQQMAQDLHVKDSDKQELPALMSERENLNQEYQHCRATYEYEMKLRNEHSEQLQLMEKNYISMVTEVEKLRMELSKASNLDKSGTVYASNAAYKEADTSAHQSAGQNAYEEGYGVSQGLGHMGGAANYVGDPAAQAPVRAGYDASRGNVYDASRNAGYEPSRGPGYDASRGAAVTHPAMTAGNNPGQYASAQMPAPYGAAQPPNYGSAGSGQPPNYVSTGSAQPPNYGPAGSAQPPNYAPVGAAPAPNYGSAGSAQPPNYGSAQPPNYGAAQPASYGSAQGPNPYGASQVPPAYRTSQAPTQAAPAASGSGYEAPHAGNAVRR